MLLLLRELIAVRPIINCGEIGTLKLHAATIAERNIGGAVIDLVKKQAVLHLKVRITLNERSLEFEHHHRNGTLRRLDGVLVGVDARGKCRERAQADAVAALQYVGIAVAEAVADNRRDADLAAECRAHPEHIVVAPLDINGRMLHEKVEDAVRAVAAVVEIADDVDALHREPLDQRTERLNIVWPAADLHNGLNQLAVVRKLCLIVLGTRAQQLHNDRLIAFRDVVAHLARGEFPAHELCQFKEIREILLIPERRSLPLRRQLLHLLPRVVDERTELRALLHRHAGLKAIVHLFLDDARAVVENMEKGIVCTVQIAHKVLRALRQYELRLQVDDFLVDNLLRRILLRHQAKNLILRCCRCRHAISSCTLIRKFIVSIFFCILPLNCVYFNSIFLFCARTPQQPHGAPCPRFQRHGSSPPSLHPKCCPQGREVRYSARDGASAHPRARRCRSDRTGKSADHP